MSKLEDEVEVGNPQQAHCATVLLLDTSGAMAGPNIMALNQGLADFKEEVLKDEVASKRVDLAVVTFGGEVKVAHAFSSIDDFQVSPLTAEGATRMGEGIWKAMEMIEKRKQQYREIGTDYYRPWLFLISAGEPTDMRPGDAKWDTVIKLVHAGEAAGKFMFFAVAAEKANMELLAKIAPPNRPPARLMSGKWKELFGWLTRSSAANSTEGGSAKMEHPQTAGWGEVSV